MMNCSLFASIQRLAIVSISWRKLELNDSHEQTSHLCFCAKHPREEITTDKEPER